MASRPEAWRTAAAGAVGALALFFGTGLDPLWPLLWVAPVPLLMLAYRDSALRTAAVGFLAWFTGGLNLWGYLRRTLGVPLPIVLALMALPALAWALTLLLSRALLRRGAPVRATLAVPALWVSFEYGLSRLSPHGTYGNLAYTQSGLVPLLQVAAATGLWGITFIVLLAAAALAVGLHLRGTGGPAVRVPLGAAVLVAAVLVWGAIRVGRPAGGVRLPVALLAVDGARGPLALPDGDEGLRLVEAYAAQVAGWRHGDAQLLVLPEKIAALDDVRMERARAALASAAAAARVTLVAGLLHEGAERSEIVALAFAPDGRPLGTYAKHHLLPPFESRATPGTTTLVLGGAPGWGVQICKDMDFPALSRRYAQGGAGLMAVPAWDFVADGRLHSRMAALRGVEGGFAVVRSARGGRLTASDARGRIVAERTSGPRFDFVTATVEVGAGRTLYSRAGDWFAWLTLLLLGVCLAGLVRTARPA